MKRQWVIYERKTRQIVSRIYWRRRRMKRDLSDLNDYCGWKKYAVLMMKLNADGKVVSRYPKIKLQELSL